MKMRLIDAEELEKANCGRCKESKDGKWSIDCLWISCQWGDVMPVIQKLPTVEPQSAWIPCSERMPENETEVLIFCPDLCDRIKKAMFIEDGFHEERTDLIVKPGEYCTHWMPLPEPPKEVAE